MHASYYDSMLQIQKLKLRGVQRIAQDHSVDQLLSHVNIQGHHELKCSF